MMNLKNIMEEEIKLNLKLEKCVVLPGKLSGYHTEGFLGEGCYGKVVKCTRLDTKEIVAVKIVRKDCFREGKKEARMLKKIRQLNPKKNNLVMFIENFKYKGHFCLAFEMLDMNIYEFMRSRDFAPLRLSEIRVIAQQLLVALNALKSARLVHADIKPDNIMLVDHKSQPFKVKLIDFGLAVKVSKLWFVGTIQAIGYRAPEVILGLKMDESVDLWSLGCCLAYMYLGYNLYPTHCVYEFIRAIIQIQGQPPDDVLKTAMDVQNFFAEPADCSDHMFRLKTPAEYTSATGFGTQLKGGIYSRLHSLDDLLKTRPRPKDPRESKDALRFISLLKRMLLVDPNVRITPGEALGHNFITMKHLSGGRNNSYVASAWKVVTDCQLQIDLAERLADKEQRQRTLIKVRPRFTVQQESAEQPDSATNESKDESSDKEQIGRTFIKVGPLFAAHQESAETADKPAGKSKYIPLGKTLYPEAFERKFVLNNKTTFCISYDQTVHRGGNTTQQKGSESKASGKGLKDKVWKGRAIIKVKPYSAADNKRQDRADKEDVSLGKDRFSSTTAGTPKKCSAAEKDAIFCKEGKPSDLVEVKTRRTLMKRTWKFFSRLMASISCIK